MILAIPPERPDRVVVMPRPQSATLPCTLLLSCVLGLSGCIHIHNVDDEQMPPAWREGVAAVTVFRNPSGRYRSDGSAVNSKGAVNPVRLANVFFPGRFRRRDLIDSVDLKFDPAGKFTATVWNGSHQLAEATWPAELDGKSGWISIKSISVEDNLKFGAVSSTQSVRLALSPDGALYVKVRSSGAGIVLFLPAAGTSSVWGRFEPVPSAAPVVR